HRPGRCLETPSGRWTLQLRCTARGDPLPPRTTRPEGAAVTNVAAVLASDGVLFGMSVLGSSGPQTWLSRLMLDSLNRRGTFDNLSDTEEGLNEILAASFEQVELTA